MQHKTSKKAIKAECIVSYSQPLISSQIVGVVIANFSRPSTAVMSKNKAGSIISLFMFDSI